jgi:pentatricopeptide repeat protein
LPIQSNFANCIKPDITLNLLIDACIEMGQIERAVNFVEEIMLG